MPSSLFFRLHYISAAKRASCCTCWPLLFDAINSWNKWLLNVSPPSPLLFRKGELLSLWTPRKCFAAKCQRPVTWSETDRFFFIFSFLENRLKFPNEKHRIEEMISWLWGLSWKDWREKRGAVRWCFHFLFQMALCEGDALSEPPAASRTLWSSVTFAHVVAHRLSTLACASSILIR